MTSAIGRFHKTIFFHFHFTPLLKYFPIQSTLDSIPEEIEFQIKYMQVHKVHTLCHVPHSNAVKHVKGAFKHIKMLSRGKLLPR